MEFWNQSEFQRAGLDFVPAQSSISHSKKRVLRGLHLQEPAQKKLVTLIAGRTLHVGVDLRPGTPDFGRTTTITLESERSQSLLLEAGFAHGFYALEDSVVAYLCDQVHNGEGEWSIAWDDPSLKIDWVDQDPILSERDSQALSLAAYCNARGYGKPSTCT